MNPLWLIIRPFAAPVAAGVALILSVLLFVAVLRGNGLERSIEAPKTGWRAQVAAWKFGYEDWRRYGKNIGAAYVESERLRGEETLRADSAISNSTKACDARVALARQSARRISDLVSQEAPRDPVSHCPIRQLYDPGELRDAIQP